MNKKIMWGILIIFAGLFYLLRPYIDESTLKYVFNYQVILILLGLSFLFQKNKTLGYILTFLGIYLYLQEFFGKHLKISFPVILLGIGIFVLVSGINENKKNKRNYGKNEIIEAEEIK